METTGREHVVVIMVSSRDAVCECKAVSVGDAPGGQWGDPGLSWRSILW